VNFLLELLRQDLTRNDLSEQADHFVFELKRHLALLASLFGLGELLRDSFADFLRVPLHFILPHQFDVFAFSEVLVWVLPEQVVQDGVHLSRDRLVSKREESHEEDYYVGEEVARVKRPHEHDQQNLIRLRQPRVLVEEKGSFKLVHLV